MQTMHSKAQTSRFAGEGRMSHIHGPSIVAQYLTLIGNFAKISDGQESAQINALFFIMSVYQVHLTLVMDFYMAVCSANLQQIFQTRAIYAINFQQFDPALKEDINIFD